MQSWSSDVKRYRKFWLIFTALLASHVALASPATFVTALPVAKDQLLARLNWNPTFASQDLTSFQFPFNVAYGLNAKWTLFTTFNLQHTSLTSQTADGPRQLGSGGLGDTLAFVRYTIFSVDKPKSTFRIAPLAGISLPTGSSMLQNSHGLLPPPLQTGSGGVSPYIGVASGRNSTFYGFAGDSTFRHNPVEKAGITPGDQFRADAEEELRLYPLTLPKLGLANEVWLSIEENYQHNSLTHIGGNVSPGSNGSSFFQDAVVEYATLHYEVGAGIQIPVVQDLNSASAIREKRQFLFFTEYYLSGFKRRTK